MPDSASTAKQNDIVRELVGQFPQKQIHAYRITIGHDQEAGFTGQRFHRSIGVSVLPYMVAGHTGTGPLCAPAVFGLVDSSETSFILEHQTHFSTISSAIVDFHLQFPHFFFNFFEVAMTSSLAFSDACYAASPSSSHDGVVHSRYGCRLLSPRFTILLLAPILKRFISDSYKLPPWTFAA